MTALRIDDIIARLENVQKQGGGYTARCPAHDDNRSSLSIGEGRDKDRVLLKCHAGCNIQDICGALNIKTGDLFYEQRKQTKPSYPPRGTKPEAIYTYTDENGVVVHQTIRNGKQYGQAFSQRRPAPDNSNKWIYNMQGIQTVLYRLSEVIQAVKEEKPIFVVEGEKDADRLCELGFTATTNPMGAGKWKEHYNEWLKGGKVYIIPDNDEAGSKHRDIVYSRLKDICDVKIIDLAKIAPNFKEHGDISDYLDNVKSTDPKTEIQRLIDMAEAPQEESEQINLKQTSKLLEQITELNPHKKYSTDDKGLGELFADVYKDTCRYNITAKEWYFFNGKIWTEDTGSMNVSRLAKKLSDVLLQYATGISGDEERRKYIVFVSRLGSFRNRKTMLDDSRDKYYISHENLDKDIYLFNCQNGTLNLKTFEFREHRASDLLSKISNVHYDENAKSPDFEKFIDGIMMSDIPKVEYMQRLFGYSLTGDTRLETCFILYGATTRNGKSTLVETYAYMLGNQNGYALNMKPETLAQKQNNDSRSASGDIARLDGCRFVNASEPPKRMIFDVGLLKTLLGRDSVTSRHLHEREFEFVPIFKLFMNTNFLPLILDDTLFSSGRINVITFDRHYKTEEQDKTLKERLKAKENISGLFNWCLEGLKLFYKSGAEPPATVAEATSDYRNSSDKIGNFIIEMLEPSKGNNIKAKVVYEAYQGWCGSNGFGLENKSNFNAELKSRGLLAKTGTVDGLTVKNVVLNYKLSEDYISECIEEYSSFPDKKNY